MTSGDIKCGAGGGALGWEFNALEAHLNVAAVK